MSDLQSLLFYLAIIFFAAFFVFLGNYIGQKKGERVGMLAIFFIVTGILLPILVSGLRYEVGIDYWSYYEKFETVHQAQSLDELKLDNTISYIDPSFLLIAYTVTLFSDDPWPLLMLYSAITVCFMYLGLRNLLPKKYLWIGFLVYLLMFYPESMNQIRQAAAIAVSFFFMAKYITTSSLRWLLGILLGAVLHSSALISLVAVPIIYIYSMRKRHRLSVFFSRSLWGVFAYAIALACIVVLLFFAVGYFTVRFDDAIDIGARVGGNYSLIILNGIKIAVLIVALWLLFDSKQDSRATRVTIMLAIAGLLLVIISGFSQQIFYRLGSYWMVFLIVPIISLIEVFANGHLRRILVIMIISASIVSFTRSHYVLNSINIIPYQSVMGRER